MFIDCSLLNQKFSEFEQKILDDITEEKWLKLAAELIKAGIPNSWAAKAVVAPPPSVRRFKDTIGAKKIGIRIFISNNSVAVSISTTLRMTRGRNAIESIAWRLRRRVVSSFLVTNNSHHRRKSSLEHAFFLFCLLVVVNEQCFCVFSRRYGF